MRRQDQIALAVISLVIGGFLSVGIPVFFIGMGLRLDAAWIIFAPGWELFRPGRDDLFEILFATILDTVIYGALIYGVVFGIATVWRRVPHN